MCDGCHCLSPHEQQVIGQLGEKGNAFRNSRPRIARIVGSFENQTPRLDIERALYFTRSMRETEGQPLILRWAKAMKHVAENITVYIDDDQLLAGRVGKPGRYGIMYPEVEGDFYEVALQGLSTRENSQAMISEEDLALVMKEIGPYWRGKTYHENFNRKLPKEVRDLIFLDEASLTT